ncbi:MAG: hypothetical protein KJ578_14900 [Bacteroidetes bacterium]|nr:hypothetical protein [Bacteroidota bacterium]MBU1579024.1 hypothetical protein [Bacteroidota bacterium]MBU2466906.1 hypothetical protein [Bacteroidota bacterium]MBU2559065.1 hypothetical protein [Bacteroidota bacterium]
MSTKPIKELIRLYFEGQTSLEQEQQLRAYFEQEELPDELKALKPLFSLSAKKTEALQDKFDQSMMQHIAQSETEEKTNTNRFLYWPLAAASVALILFVSSLFNLTNNNQFEETYNDPAVAYAQASNALQFVGLKLSSGLQPVQTAGNKLEKGIDQVDKMQVLYTGMEETKKLGLIDQTRNYLTNQ